MFTASSEPAAGQAAPKTTLIFSEALRTTMYADANNAMAEAPIVPRVTRELSQAEKDFLNTHSVRDLVGQPAQSSDPAKALLSGILKNAAGALVQSCLEGGSENQAHDAARADRAPASAKAQPGENAPANKVSTTSGKPCTLSGAASAFKEGFSHASKETLAARVAVMQGGGALLSASTLLPGGIVPGAVASVSAVTATNAVAMGYHILEGSKAVVNHEKGCKPEAKPGQ